MYLVPGTESHSRIVPGTGMYYFIGSTAMVTIVGYLPKINRIHSGFEATATVAREIKQADNRNPRSGLRLFVDAGSHLLVPIF